MNIFTAVIISLLVIVCIVIASSLIVLLMLSSEIDDAWEQFLEEYLKSGGGDSNDIE